MTRNSNGDHLIIRGEKVSIEPKGEYRIREIRHGDYYHELTIDREKINAAIKIGVVTLTLGIKESEKPRNIKVMTE